MPLSPGDLSRDQLVIELNAFEAKFHRFSKIFSALAHETRLRMMKRLIEEDDLTMNFADFMRDLNLNPKIVWENTRKLQEGGLIEKVERGRYRCSESGQREFMLISFAFRRLMEALSEMDSY